MNPDDLHKVKHAEFLVPVDVGLDVNFGISLPQAETRRAVFECASEEIGNGTRQADDIRVQFLGVLLFSLGAPSRGVTYSTRCGPDLPAVHHQFSGITH